MARLDSLDGALKQVATDRKPHALLGNGFSRAWRDDIFRYAALFDSADFTALSPFAKAAFDALQTRDFEVVMRALRSAAALNRLYAKPHTSTIRQMKEDADGLREVLVRAIADRHPSRPSDVSTSQYAACKAFLARFNRVYTLNYDLLLYWALMQSALKPAVIADDGFRTPDSGKEAYVSWEPEKSNRQNVFYLHGGLHLFDAGDEVQKYTWVNTGIPLIEQIRSALGEDRFPIFVTEGRSSDKYARIRHSDYLSRCYRSFVQIQGTLVCYGWAFGDADAHITRAIRKSGIQDLVVGVFGPPKSPSNKKLIKCAQAIEAMRPPDRPIKVRFYDAATVQVWSRSG